MVKAFEMLKEAAMGIGTAVLFGAVVALALTSFGNQVGNTTAAQNHTQSIISNGTSGLATLFSFTGTQATIVAVVVIILIVGLIRFKTKN